VKFKNKGKSLLKNKEKKGGEINIKKKQNKTRKKG